jgi:hypothetical protein
MHGLLAFLDFVPMVPPIGSELMTYAASSKAYIFETKLNGKTIRMTIGDPSNWGIGKAQVEASRLKVMTDQGINPRQVIDNAIAAYLQGLLLTGARRNELAALRWADVDFQWKSLTIRDKVEGERTIPLTPNRPQRSPRAGRLKAPRLAFAWVGWRPFRLLVADRASQLAGGFQVRWCRRGVGGLSRLSLRKNYGHAQPRPPRRSPDGLDRRLGTKRYRLFPTLGNFQSDAVAHPSRTRCRQCGYGLTPE